jgi:dTDP-4-amino-4,6-dideoxygalactose transaminase
MENEGNQMNKINVLKPRYRTQEVLDEIKICLDKGWTGMGFKTIEFEEAWKEYTKLPHAHFINSNTSGLHLALNILGRDGNWGDGDEIITTPLTFVSTNHAILYMGFKPVFADVDETLCLDPQSIKDRITSKTKAVMYVGMGGNAGNLKEIKDICKYHGLKLILDAAHMSGTYTREMAPEPSGGGYAICHTGWEADVSIFSFQSVKNLPTADSGMICFKEEKHDKLVRQLSWLGIDKDTYSRSDDKGSYKWKYDVPNVGFKYHGNSIMASVGLVQLKYIDEDNDYRNIITDWYDELLEGVDGIKKIPLSWHTDKSSKHVYQILVDEDKRDDIITHFYENDIYPGVHYIDNTLYPMYKYAHGTCPNAHKYSKQLITLPIHLNLTEKDIKRVVKTLGDIL